MPVTNTTKVIVNGIAQDGNEDQANMIVAQDVIALTLAEKNAVFIGSKASVQKLIKSLEKLMPNPKEPLSIMPIIIEDSEALTAIRMTDVLRDHATRFNPSKNVILCVCPQQAAFAVNLAKFLKLELPNSLHVYENFNLSKVDDKEYVQRFSSMFPGVKREVQNQVSSAATAAAGSQQKPAGAASAAAGQPLAEKSKENQK
jgi:hypothetical protein